jgi:superfamily I DNA and/or RNA helicase
MGMLIMRYLRVQIHDLLSDAQRLSKQIAILKASMMARPEPHSNKTPQRAKQRYYSISTTALFDDGDDRMVLKQGAVSPSHRTKYANVATNRLTELFMELRNQYVDLGFHTVHRMKEVVDEMMKRANELERIVHLRVIREAEVVCSTCAAAGHEMLDQQPFNQVVVDEASQIHEPELLIALKRASKNGSITLIGDEKQLPPVIQHPDSMPLRSTLFERIIHNRANGGSLEDRCFPTNVSLLSEQYRMHPAICAWPNWAFYAGLIRNNASLHKDAGGHHSKSLPFQRPLSFVSCKNGKEENSTSSESKYNPNEATLLVEAVRKTMAACPSLVPADIGIITPYLAQVQHISRKLQAAGFRVLEGMNNRLDDDGIENLLPKDVIEVRSVDGYQGREKAVVFMSTVRANSDKNVGFLADYRRLNVSLTRAKHSLIVIGHAPTLQSDPMWASWLRFVDSNEFVVDSLDGMFAATEDHVEAPPLRSPLEMFSSST